MPLYFLRIHVSGINLEQFVETNQYLDDPKIWSIAKQLLDGLSFLSSRGIMHTDLHRKSSVTIPSSQIRFFGGKYIKLSNHLTII